MIATAVGLLLALTSVALGLAVRDDVPGVDRVLRDAASGLPAWITDAAAAVSLVLSPALATIALASLAARALLARDPLLFRAAVVFGLCWSTLLARHAYLRVRPIEFPLPSYPSGHVTAVASVAVTAVLLTGRLARRHLVAAVVLGAVAVVVTAAARVALRFHWFTDTVGAVLGVVGVGLVAGHALGLLPRGVGSSREQH
ncbi:phosphatase PAP2 family protein [Actinosynnema sp. NPDC020468]|uniref:phosphatase PAP2 family protein n=1 Tax=Actinosynnema sp. NPDC020468 TaxID=3154488 RepID=UPI0033E64F0C